MGQRLIIQIEEYGRPLANAYYHWSAYTMSSAELTNVIINEDYSADTNELYKNATTDQEKKLLRVVNLLRCTGAEILYDDLEIFKSKYPNTFDLFLAAQNRNDGLIALTEKSIDDNMSYAEGTVILDIGTYEVKFEVMWYEDDLTYLIDDGYITSEEDIQEIESDVENLTFKNFDKFFEELQELIKNGQGYFKTKQGDVYSIIE